MGQGPSAQSGDAGPSPANTAAGDAATSTAAPPVAASSALRDPSSTADSGSAAPPAAPADPAAADAEGAAPPSLAAAADEAEQLLTALRQEGERAGYTLRGVPDAQLEAVRTACYAVTDSAGLDAAHAQSLLAGRSGLWSAALHVHATALRDTACENRWDMDYLLWAVCGVLRVALDAWARAMAAGVQGEAYQDAGVATFGADLSLALVQGDALQAHARVLAQRHQQLRAAVQADQAAADQRDGRVLRDAMVSAYTAARVAMATIQLAARPLACVDDRSHAELYRQLQAALIHALHASNVLEHLARLRMELQQAELQLGERAVHLLHRAYNPADLDILWGPLMSILDAAPNTQYRYTFVVFTQGTCAPALSGVKPHLRLGGADGLGGAPLLQQLRSLARQPCLQLYAGWRLAAHLCHEAGAQLFGMPDSLLPVQQLSTDGRLANLQAAATLWSWALWAPTEASDAGGAAAAQGSAAQPLPPLPYKPVHMVRLLCGALPAVGEGSPERLYSSVALVCYRALLHYPMPLAEAEAMLRVAWPAIMDSLRRNPGCWPPTAGRLLRLTRGAAADGGDAAAVGPSVPLSLSCALEAGLLRGVEGFMRSVGRICARFDGALHELDHYRDAMFTMDQVLRRPGVWPAVLAHAPPRQVAALVVTLRKMLQATKLRSHIHVAPCRFQLVALLEQAAAVLWASPSGGSSSSAGAGRRGACRSLPFNRHATDALELYDGEAVRAPPTLTLLAALGGCPAPSSPAAQQQRTLAVFALSQWLPCAFIAVRDAGPVGFCFYDLEQENGQPLLCWLHVVAEECLGALWAAADQQRNERERLGKHASGGAAAGGSGAGASGSSARQPRPIASAAYASWRQLLCTELRVATVLLTWLSKAIGDASRKEAQFVDRFLDLLALLVAAVPEHVAGALQPGQPFAPMVGDGQTAVLTKHLLQRHGRERLWAALCMLGRAAQHGSLPPEWQPPEQLLAEAPHLRQTPSGSAPEWAPLPLPCEAAGVLPLCSYPDCTSFDGESEADATLRACARCRAARYCSPACQRAHWAAGHKAECAGGSARG